MKKTIRIILLVFFVVVLLFSLWQLCGIFIGYQEGKDSYYSLEQYVSFTETENSAVETVSPEEDATENSDAGSDTPDLSAWPQVDFTQLSEINSDIVGWIYIEGTHINYPIVQGSDNKYYLNHLFNGTYNGSGCIFLDYRCTSDFTDRHSIIYGHHMKDKSMFSGLVNYKKQSFYDEHPVALLVTPSAYYEICFFSGYVTDTWSDAWDRSFTEYEYISWLNDIQRKSLFTADYVPTNQDKIMTLSTCTYEFDTAKFVLHGYISQVIENT